MADNQGRLGSHFASDDPQPTGKRFAAPGQQPRHTPLVSGRAAAHAAGSHQGHGWEQFTDAVMAHLSAERDNLVFILWGSYAQKKGQVIDRSRHLVLTSAHPSPLSAYRGFFGNHHFSLCNDYLIRHGISPIVW